MPNPARDNYVKEMPNLVIGEWPPLDVNSLPDLTVVSLPPVDINSLPIPTNAWIRRIDLFAALYMQAAVSDEVLRTGFIGKEHSTGVHRFESLAELAYEAAAYMQAKSETV